ncbi:F0F1 ATP synthase subunit B [Synechococcus sp. RSCCF101]|uniref:F0F1 ATP synthase subunit B n=1 Tax=Synechococcus sp. RSCCF101 TaxID=2511069 RepID=UPI001246B71F|nr:F0F1 ATP synthase subunit B [Synechococcus sp. RSCCF101]QEY33125.1 F0F1 ATP synthase subunit B [Synechococcus sp. RSCCF101]
MHADLHHLVLASHGGFGFNFNPLETNLVNLVITIAVLTWFLRGFLGGILERRRQAILSDLSDAEQRLAKAETSLAAAKSELSAAQAKAQQIRADGEARAQGIRRESEMRTVEAMAALKQDALADMSAESARITEELRREAALAAIERVLEQLPSRLDTDGQQRLIDTALSNLEQA